MPSPNLGILEADLMPPDLEGFASVITPHRTHLQSMCACLACREFSRLAICFFLLPYWQSVFFSLFQTVSEGLGSLRMVPI